MNLFPRKLYDFDNEYRQACADTLSPAEAEQQRRSYAGIRTKQQIPEMTQADRENLWAELRQINQGAYGLKR